MSAIGMNRKEGIITRVNWLANGFLLRTAAERRAIQNNMPLLRKSHVHIWMAREHHNSLGTVLVVKKANAICNKMTPIRMGQTIPSTWSITPPPTPIPPPQGIPTRSHHACSICSAGRFCFPSTKPLLESAYNRNWQGWLLQ